jgi:hypothetical protein
MFKKARQSKSSVKQEVFDDIQTNRQNTDPTVRSKRIKCSDNNTTLLYSREKNNAYLGRGLNQ